LLGRRRHPDRIDGCGHDIFDYFASGVKPFHVQSLIIGMSSPWATI
jgi:hypothetical protein